LLFEGLKAGLNPAPEAFVVNTLNDMEEEKKYLVNGEKAGARRRMTRLHIV